MRFDVITLLPNIIQEYCSASIVGRVFEQDIAQLYLHNLRDHGLGNYKQVDDIPYGGGTGMILKPEPIFNCHDNIPKTSPARTKTITLTPRGQTLSQPLIRNELLNNDQLIIICGRYEGYDARVNQLADYEISLGNYILTGGELGAMTIIDSIIRLLPGAFSQGDTVHEQDSFSDEQGIRLEADQYTRPHTFRDMSVPEVLLSGNHKAIEEWRNNN